MFASTILVAALTACTSTPVDTGVETTQPTTETTTSTVETGTTETGTTTTPTAGKTPKVLLFMIDGFIPDGITTSDTPVIDKLMVDSAWSLKARAESTTISGSGWSTFLTGVHYDKHGVSSNDFSWANYGAYPHIFTRIKEAKPDMVVAECQIWEPIWSGLVLPTDGDYLSHHDYDDYSSNYLDDASSDWLCTDEVITYASVPEVDLLIMMYGDLDGVGHTYGYGAEYSDYQWMLNKIDTAMGDIIATIEARPTYAGEDWLIILSADHAGDPTYHHGLNIPEHREIPLIVSGPSVAAGEIWPAPQAVDIVPTALHHLGVAVQESWDLDGVVIGMTETSPPVAELGINLIFNGDAEYERGSIGYDSVPDVSLPGWSDDGYFTVIEWDSPGGYPVASDAGPSDRGNNLFAGGWTSGDSVASWTVDLSPLATTIESGAQYDLSAWLGGYSNQDDAIRVTAEFFDASGASVGTSMLPPVLAAERGNATGLLEKSRSGDVPTGTRSVTVTLDALLDTGDNDGYADNISLVITGS